MPNGFAYIMLLAWPAVAAVLFARLPPGRALIWTVLAGYLLLPPLAAFDLPALPALNKETIPNLCALAAALLGVGAGRARAAARPPGAPPEGPAESPPPPLPPAVRLLLVLFVVSPFATVLTNPEALVYPRPPGELPRILPALSLYDSIAAVGNQAVLILPFFLARRWLAGPEAARDLVAALALAGLAYSLPMLLEIRLSPQLNVWVYGFFQHDFLQMMRGGGFRPIVFLPHALWATFFLFTALMAAAALARHGPPAARPLRLAAVLWLAATLVLSKTVGPMVFAAALVPVVLLAPVGLQLRLAALMGAVAVAYPLLRGAGLVPIDALVEQFARLDPARAGSLAYRFAMEELLLDHAAAKPWFGWGGFARNHVYDPWDGRLLTVADGRWIIVLGLYGWLGYIAEFGLLALPLALLVRASRRPGAAVAPEAGAAALILGANLIDLLPNATLIPFTWLLAGALLGQAQTALARTAPIQTAPARTAAARARPPQAAPAPGQGARPAEGGGPADPARPRTIL